VLDVFRGQVTWKWCFDQEQQETRLIHTLRLQRSRQLTEAEFSLISTDPAYTLKDVAGLLLLGPENCDSSAQFSPIHYTWEGFLMQDDIQWTDILHKWLPKFDPAAFLVRRVNSEAPTGDAKGPWVQCVKAITNLLSQTEVRDDEGFLKPDQLYDQLVNSIAMLARCLPIRLLRVQTNASTKAKQNLIRHNCHLFLRGSWPSLVLKANRELTQLNEASKQSRTNLPGIQQSQVRREQTILARARAMQYSRAMNLLRSSGLSTASGEDTSRALQDLHPSEELDINDLPNPRNVPITPEAFNFIKLELPLINGAGIVRKCGPPSNMMLI